MRMKGEYIILLFAITFCVIRCTKPYAPKAISSPNNYLVVEGIINTGNDSTMVKLSRTVNLNAAVSEKPELGATIVIQDNQNASYSLKSIGKGFYTSPILNLDGTRKYRLSITTSDGKVYLSDYLSPVITPPIDSVGFAEVNNKQEGAGLQIYLNTHDPQNNTHYYRWDYTETWLFHAKYYSGYVTNFTTIVPRTPAQNIYQCYGNDISNNILLESSARLTQDIIYQAPIIFIASTSEKIEIRYSILLKQYALSSDGYNYFSQLKKNTENLGSIFDAQPSQLTGNVHCTTDATVPVIGYVTAGTVQQKRIFIDNSQLPPTWVPTYPFSCELDTALYSSKMPPFINEVQTWLVPNTAFYPVSTLGKTGYTFTDGDCADCTIRGTTTEPSFWR